MFGAPVAKVEWLTDLLTICGFSADTKYPDKNCLDNFCAFVLPRAIQNLSARRKGP